MYYFQHKDRGCVNICMVDTLSLAFLFMRLTALSSIWSQMKKNHEFNASEMIFNISPLSSS